MRKSIILVIILSILIGVIISYWDKLPFKENSSQTSLTSSLSPNSQVLLTPSPTPSPIPIDSNTNLKETVEKNSSPDFSGDFDLLKKTVSFF